MARMKTRLMGAALAVGLLVLVHPALSLVSPLYAQQVNCGGSFTPDFNCIINGIWNYPNGLKTNGSNFQTASVLLSNAQILNLSSPTGQVTIIPDPGAGFVNVVLYGSAAFNETSTYAAGGDLKLFYTNRQTGNAASGVITFAGLLDTAASNNEVFTGTIAGPEPGRTNKAVVIQQVSQAAMTGGSGANTLLITVTYQSYAIGALK